jgi:hypothetical protein
MTIGCIIFACIAGGTLIGMMLRAFLPQAHLSAETKDVVKLGMGLIGTMTALVLGLLIASAKSSFDTQRTGVAQMAGNVMFLDHILVLYGPGSSDARKEIHDSLVDLHRRTWPAENPESGYPVVKSQTEGRYDKVYEKIQDLAPDNDAQRTLKDQALKTATDIGQARWVLFAQKGSSIPTAFLVVMVAWLTLIFASFGLFAPPKPMAVVTLLICALAVSSAIFLILELDRPFDGMIQISSAPVRSAIAQLERPEK